MTAPTATRAATITAEVHQLTQPIHVAIQGRIITHPPLLDQLRDAATPSNNPGSGIRQAPASRPPARLHTIELLSEIYTGVSAWHARLNLPSPDRDTDWQKSALRMLATRAADLPPATANWLAIEVTEWWHAAAVGSGWQPAQLRKLQ
jgi:hypothetical protein